VQTSTHGLTIGATEVRKEFVADHEEQAEREWASLALLAEHAPGLAPRPLRREDGETPVIVMERIPGEPLAPRPLTTLQTQALGASLRRLYDVPVEVVREAGGTRCRPCLRRGPAGARVTAHRARDRRPQPRQRAVGRTHGLDDEARERMAAYRPLWAAFWLAMLLPGNGGWRRNPRGTTEGQARHFLALVDELEPRP
jgi:hypothetical protein